MRERKRWGRRKSREEAFKTENDSKVNEERTEKKKNRKGRRRREYKNKPNVLSNSLSYQTCLCFGKGPW